jgi:hypothetical protein
LTPDRSDQGWAFSLNPNKFVVRLAVPTKSGPRGLRALHAHAADLAVADARTAARHGLLSAVLGILMCCDEQAASEDVLFKTLCLDPRLAAVRQAELQSAAAGAGAGAGAGAAGGGGGGARAEQLAELFADCGGAAEYLARWTSVVSKDLVAARFLTREKVKDSVDEATGVVREKWVYGVGPAARAGVGALGALELVRSLKGGDAAAPAAVGFHPRATTMQLMPKEVGSGSGGERQLSPYPLLPVESVDAPHA